MKYDPENAPDWLRKAHEEPCELQARTGLAMEIAKVDQARFNEAVASGHYPCAPKTIPGKARTFDIDDLVALRVYGHLIEEGMLPARAGGLVCALRDLLRQNPNATEVVWVKTSFGDEGWHLSSNFDPEEPFFNEGDIVSFREWRLAVMRSYIKHRLDAARRVVR